MRTINRLGGMLNHLSMAYLLSNICTQNYWHCTLFWNYRSWLDGILFWDTV